jgi:hypothetical protein
MIWRTELTICPKIVKRSTSGTKKGKTGNSRTLFKKKYLKLKIQ